MSDTRISLDPLPMEQFQGLSERERNLQHIGDVIAYWLKWVTGVHSSEGISISPDTYIRLPGPNAPPHWPSVGQLTKWLEILRDRDRHPEGDETRSGSVERSEIEPGPKASPK